MKHNTLMRRLIIYFIFAAFIPAVLTASIIFFQTREEIKSTLINDNNLLLNQISEQISQKIQQVDDFSYWLCQNSDINALLQLSEEKVHYYTPQKAKAINDIRTQLSYRPIAEDILSLFVVGNNGLDIRAGVEASLVDRDLLQDYIKRFTDDYWSGVMRNLTPFSNYSSVLMYCHPINWVENNIPLGYVILVFSEDFLLNELRYFTENHERYALLLNNHNQILSLACEGTETIEILSNFYSKEANSEYLKLTVVNSTSHLTLHGLISTSSMNKHVYAAARSAFLLLGITLAVALMVSYFLSVNFNRPIEHIMNNITYISNGSFNHLKELKDNSELGNLNHQIIQMSHDICSLMEERNKREKEKYRHEVQLLQAQINPHFLYNTLNSIRLMANMQGVSNISSMVEALGKLLKANQTITNEWITLQQELDLLESYLYIQNIRFKGKIQTCFKVSHNSLLNEKILKFTLQPLVENSIIHGLSEKPHGGYVYILCDSYKECLRIRILDNGKGVEPERLNKIQQSLLLLEENKYSSESIGICNVSRRIQIWCGNQYGVSIKNRSSSGVSVTVTFPLKKREDNMV